MAKVLPYHTNSTQYPHATSRVAVSASGLPPRSLNSPGAAWAETFGDPNNFAGPRVNSSLICTVAVVCLAWLIWGVSPALATPVASVNPIAGDGQSAALSAAFAAALKVQVVGPCGELLSGLTVNFTAPSSGASATFPDG